MKQRRLDVKNYITLRDHLKESGMSTKDNDLDEIETNFLAHYQAVHDTTYYKYDRQNIEAVYCRGWLRQITPLLAPNLSLLKKYLGRSDCRPRGVTIRKSVIGWLLGNYNTLGDSRTVKLIEEAVLEKATQAEYYEQYAAVLINEVTGRIKYVGEYPDWLVATMYRYVED